MASSVNGTGNVSSSPCGACKFLRRKCAADCIFAPYFCSEQGTARFAAIHKVFGASNVSKLLVHVPVQDRGEAVVTIAYEAQARIRDPVYGCVAHIFSLQQQVSYLQAQLMQVKTQIAQNLIQVKAMQNQWPGSGNIATGGGGVVQFPTDFINSNISPQSSIESVEYNVDSMNNNMQEIQSRHHHCQDDDYYFSHYSNGGGNLHQSAEMAAALSKKRPPSCDLSELQTLAFGMMKH